MFEKKTWVLKNHISLADLYLFAFFYDTVVSEYRKNEVIIWEVLRIMMVFKWTILNYVYSNTNI